MCQKVRVLALCGCNSLIKRGVEQFLINIYKNIDHDKVSIDFLTAVKCENNDFFELTEKYGDRVIEFGIGSSKWKKYRTYYKKLIEFFVENKYDVVHVNTGDLIAMSLGVKAAYRAKVPVRIVHSHNDGLNNFKHKILKLLTRKNITKCPTHYFACSRMAAEFVFPPKQAKNADIVPNGIDLPKYCFDEKFRDELRTEYNLDDKIVLGHVGAFIEQKNHKFLIEVFNKLVKVNDNYRLVLIGEGAKREEISDLTTSLGISEYVIFIGRSNCVEKWLSAFDIYVFPSKWEGFGIALLEAQVAGLPCLISDTITKEVQLLSSTKSLSISKKDSVSNWANAVIECEKKDKRSVDTDALSNFDIVNVGIKLTDFYLRKNK